MRSLLPPLLLLTALLAGCTARLTPPRVQIEAGGPVTVEVEAPGEKDRFCPPGQKKKITQHDVWKFGRGPIKHPGYSS